jgi:glutamate synthase (NADPH) large chain
MMDQGNMKNDVEDQQQKSMYVPSAESDACGIGFIANIKGVKSHAIVNDALTMLENMEHRGAIGSDPETGDGAGILVQMPDAFLRKECTKMGLTLPEFGLYGVGMIFFPGNQHVRESCRKFLCRFIDELGFDLLGFRIVPSAPDSIGKTALKHEPQVEQVFVRHRKNLTDMDLQRKLYVLRQHATHTINRELLNDSGEFYFTSFSYKTMVYKGQFRTHQVRAYYPDLSHDEFITAIALIHSRYSTNTFPKWRLAQPFRYLAHNGEINTVRGNMNWMHSNETILESTKFTPEEIRMLRPIMDEANSDSGNLDLMVEILVMGGRSLPHVLMMLVPEAWQESKKMTKLKKDFYAYHASIMEPWDGPASLCFTDGKIVGATLDRNGLRPSRLFITKDDRIIVSSEAGALPIDPALIEKKWRVQPGKMIIADLERGVIIGDDEIKNNIAKQKPYGRWLELNETHIDNLPTKDLSYPFDKDSLLTRQQAFGFSQEDVHYILREMAQTGKEPIGSMGSDVAIAILSNQSRNISNYFKQQFAQVSNPPIDPIRERMVMSLKTSVGGLLTCANCCLK